MVIARLVAKIVSHFGELIARHLRKVIEINNRSAIGRAALYDVARCRLTEPFSVETVG